MNNKIALNEISFIGSDLQRPECVLCTKRGTLYASDWRGGVSQIDAQGLQTAYLSSSQDFEVKPNGIALMPDGSFLLAHLGNEEGGVYRLTRKGDLNPFLFEIEGKILPPTNFVHIDHEGRIWITVSTRIKPRQLAYRPDTSDGFIICVDEDEARIVADGLGYTNECLVHPSGQWLYVNETFARRLSRFEITEHGYLLNKETVTEFGEGVFPDGLTFDVEGGMWVTSIVSNKVIRVDQDRKQTIMLEDNDPEHVAWVEHAFQAGEMGRPHLDGIKSQCLKNISSLAFGGKNLKTIYLGCLLGNQIACWQSPIAGLPPVHWEFEYIEHHDRR